VIADLKGDGEEFDCARWVDRHAQVRQWVRNLDSDPFGFSLPTSRGRYFPDLIVELTDGRLAIIEYKGRICEEKRQVREL
jgi:type III restriction enzyme